MTTSEELTLPYIAIYSLEEIQRMALLNALRDKGIDDPVAFLEQNTVAYITAFKANVGLAITITDISSKRKKSQTPKATEV